jgi:hypothetical protein
VTLAVAAFGQAPRNPSIRVSSSTAAGQASAAYQRPGAASASSSVTGAPATAPRIAARVG